MRTRIACAALVMLMGVVLANQSHGATAATHTPSTTAATHTPSTTALVTIQNFAFHPATLTVARGTTVVWINKDAVTHTVSSDQGLFNSGFLAPGKRFTHTFSTSGTFPYDCHIHPFMEATVVVK